MYNWIEQGLFVFQWLCLIGILHISFWSVFKRWIAEYAYPVSYTVSLLFFSIFSWWLGIFHLPVWLAVLPFLFVFGIMVGKGSVTLLEIRQMLKWDLLFFVFFCAMLITRIKNSAIFANESFLDMGFIASIMRNPIAPPLDPHFAGGVLDLYYYFSHWIYATLGITSGVPPTIVYNLILPTTLGISAVTCYAIGRMVIPRFPSLVLLLLIIPRPSLFFEIFNGGNKNFVQMLENSVQIIPGTGNNYPLYDLLWGLPHPHINAISIQLLIIFLILIILLKWDELQKNGHRVVLILLGFTSALLISINSWDAIFYYPLLAGVIIALLFRIVSSLDDRDITKSFRHPDLQSIILMVIAGLIVVIPYMLQLKAHAITGIGFVQTPSEMAPFILSHGWYLIIFVLYIIPDIRKKPYFLGLSIIPFICGYWGIGLLIIPLIYMVVKESHSNFDYLAGYALFILIFTEIFYLQELVDPFSRYNTVFKLSLSAWPILWVATFGMVSEFFDRINLSYSISVFQERIVGVVCCLFICLVFILAPVVPYFSVYSIDGMGYLEVYQPDDARIINLLRSDLSATGVIEAAGDYDYHARISSFTGIPAVIGWPSIEKLWGREQDEISRRVQDVERIYRDPSVTLEIMNRYNCSHLVVGPLELMKYQNISINSYGLEPQYMGESSKLIKKIPTAG